MVEGSEDSALLVSLCVLGATARKYGLCVTASRSMSFVALEPALRKEHDTAAKVTACYVASKAVRAAIRLP